ncbi:MAG: Outer membrane protein assembly factor BamE [Legionellaceae bacterium]
MKNIFTLTTLLLFLTGCTHFPFVYRPNIQQGNVISTEALKDIKPGLSAEQVRYIMGSPLLTNVLDTQHWNYVYTYKNGKTNKFESKRVIIHFVDGVVKDFDVS